MPKRSTTPMKKPTKKMSPTPNAKAYEHANPNARFKRTASPSTRTKVKKAAASKRMPTTYRTQAARARARRRYAGD